MSTRFITITAVLAIAFAGVPASADWDEGDPFKMHFPQLPDPNGWDVSFNNGPLGDDWECTETGPVNDIHMWVSFREDLGPGPETVVGGFVEIWSDVPAGADPLVPWSHPGDLLWGMGFDTLMPNVTMRHYGSGDQGWLEPPTQFIEFDHQNIWQINIDPILSSVAPFEQEAGRVYWLVSHMFADDPAFPALMEIGWKTSIEQFMDDAVYTNPAGVDPQWLPLEDPFTGQSLDLAFVITPEPATLALLTLGAVAILRRR